MAVVPRSEIHPNLHHASFGYINILMHVCAYHASTQARLLKAAPDPFAHQVTSR